MKLCNRSILTLSAIIALGFTGSAHASVVDLGAASNFVILSYNSSNVSDSAFQNGSIGVVNGDWNQSGGGRTNTQQSATVYLSPGHKNNGPGVESTVFNASLLNQAWTDAQHASSMLASLSPTQSLGNITTGQTISFNSVGNYVLSIGNISLNQSSLTLSAPKGSTFVLNISGNITLNGGSQGNGILLGGGLTSNDVIYNLTGANSKIDTTGGGNAQQIYGTVLAVGANQSVNLHPGGILGQVITTTFTSSSGALVQAVPEVTPASLMFGFLGLIVAITSRRALGARVRAVARK
jgi:hypothetical protein